MRDKLLNTEEKYLAQMEEGKLLNPRIDSTFKAMFTQNTEESRGALKSFLEAVIGVKINKLSLEPTSAPTGYKGQRDVYYDILCTFEDEQVANIEMQAFNQNYDYGNRAEYHVGRLMSTYLDKGDSWKKVTKVYQINVANFTYAMKGDIKTDIDSVASYFTMKTKEGRELGNRLNIVLIELPKVEKLLKNIDISTTLENWAMFLKYADDPSKKGLIKKLTEKEEGLMKAQVALSSISENRNYWIEQFRQETRERDIYSGIEAAEERGRAEERDFFVKKLLSSGMSEKQLSEILGIDVKELK